LKKRGNLFVGIAAERYERVFLFVTSLDVRNTRGIGRLSAIVSGIRIWVFRIPHIASVRMIK
jgi:hypothetical protein